jgi:hypothetical protein
MSKELHIPSSSTLWGLLIGLVLFAVACPLAGHFIGDTKVRHSNTLACTKPAANTHTHTHMTHSTALQFAQPINRDAKPTNPSTATPSPLTFHASSQGQA